MPENDSNLTAPLLQTYVQSPIPSAPPGVAIAKRVTGTEGPPSYSEAVLVQPVPGRIQPMGIASSEQNVHTGFEYIENNYGAPTQPLHAEYYSALEEGNDRAHLLDDQRQAEESLGRANAKESTKGERDILKAAKRNGKVARNVEDHEIRMGTKKGKNRVQEEGVRMAEARRRAKVAHQRDEESMYDCQAKVYDDNLELGTRVDDIQLPPRNKEDETQSERKKEAEKGENFFGGGEYEIGEYKCEEYETAEYNTAEYKSVYD